MKRYYQASFTSTKCPAGPDRRCGLPFGFLWTPLCHVDETESTMGSKSNKDPEEEESILKLPQCLQCLAYLNLYCDMKESTWQCPFCGFENHRASDIPPEVLVQPQLQVSQGVRPKMRPNPKTNLILVLDAQLPWHQVAAVRDTLEQELQQQYQAGRKSPAMLQLGLLIFDRNVSAFAMRSPICAAHVFASSAGFAETIGISDESENPDPKKSKKYMRYMQSPEDWQVLSNCLHAFYQPNNQKEQEDPNQKKKSRLEMLKEQKAARLRKEKEKEEGVASQEPEAPKSPWLPQRNQGRPPRRPRCTGEALQCAIELASVGNPRVARIVLVTNGAPSHGVGNCCTDADGRVIDSALLATSLVDLWAPMGTAASQGGVGIDVLCTGVEELAVPAWNCLVEPTGGYALCHDDTDSLQSNLRYIVSETYVAGLFLDQDEEGEEDEEEWSKTAGNWIDGCVLDIRMSSIIDATHLVGIGEFVEGENCLLPNERESFAAQSAIAAANGIATQTLPDDDLFDLTVTRVRLGRYDPATTLSMMLTVQPDVPEELEYAYFQCVARYMDRSGTQIFTRVTTHRLGLAKDVSSYLDSIDEEVVPVVLGKEAVYRSLYGRDEGDGAEEDEVDPVKMEKFAYDVQHDVDATIRSIAAEYRLLGVQEGARGLDLTEEGQTPAAGSSTDFAFPAELSDALRRLYYLRRGPLVSPGPMQAADDRAEKRSLFLRLPLDQCLNMMSPTVLTTGTIRDHRRVGDVSALGTAPAETMILWDKSVIAADYFSSLFVWSGKGTNDKKYDRVRDKMKKYLLESTKSRFPHPVLHMLHENDSMSRRFTALLAPSHSDPIEYQLTHFPALESLPPDEFTQLREKFKFYDADVDPSFRKWFWDVASAASISKGEDGVSLCE